MNSARRSGSPGSSKIANARRVERVPLRTRLAGVLSRLHMRFGSALAALVGRVRTRLRASGAWLRRGSLVIGLAIAGVALVQGIRRYAAASPHFAIRELVFEGQEHLTREELHQIAGLAPGQNIFARSPTEAIARLQSNPWIVTADVSRKLPGTVRVTLAERRASALLALPQDAVAETGLSAGLFVVDEDGEAFKAFDSKDPADLPLISFDDKDEALRNRQLRGEHLARVASLLREYREKGLDKLAALSEVHLGRDRRVTLYLDNTSMTRVDLGRLPTRDKLSKLAFVLRSLARRNGRASVIRLDNESRPDRVTVTLDDGSTLAAL